MKYKLVLLLQCVLFYNCSETTKKEMSSIAVDTDVTNFWEAYDAIRNTNDSLTQYQLLDSLYIRKGTLGLEAMMIEKGYTPQDYIYAINNYPKFWESIRNNTFKSKSFSGEISKEIENLKSLYPEMKPAKIYFTVGAMRSGGTTKDSLVLIGSEFAMADSTAVIHELPSWLQNNLDPFFKSNPIKDLVLMDVNMPVKDGMQATKEIRTFNNEIPIIALTAVEIEDMKDKIFNSGMNDIVLKPYNIIEFHRVLVNNIVQV